MNPVKLLKAKGAWSTFTKNHPKFPKFLSAVYQDGLEVGSILEFTVTNAEGKTVTSNIKLTESDIELFHELISQKG